MGSREVRSLYHTLIIKGYNNLLHPLGLLPLHSRKESAHWALDGTAHMDYVLIKQLAEPQLLTCLQKIEIKLSIRRAFASSTHLMGIICIHLMIYFLECMSL